MSEVFAAEPKRGKPWDVCIVGSGPSALASGIYTVRGAASTLILGGERWGGQLMLTSEVDNFPGFPEGIKGPELMSRMRKQAERFGAVVREENVIGVDFSSRPFLLKTGSEEYRAMAVIVATGAETRWLGVPGEKKLIGRGISSCAPCDAPFFKNKKVIVVGGGDSAMEEALVLTKYASEVTIIHRRDKLRASEAMQVKVRSNSKIKIVWDSEVVEFVGEKKLEKVRLKNNETGEESEMNVEGAFVAIGSNPATKVFEGVLRLGEGGHIERDPTGEYLMKTNIEGVFVSGDVHDYRYKQAVTAAGYGCMAGLEVLKYLDKEIPSY